MHTIGGMLYGGTVINMGKGVDMVTYTVIETEMSKVS